MKNWENNRTDTNTSLCVESLVFVTVKSHVCHDISNRNNFDPLWPSDTIWRHKSRSTLAQGMACCLTAPNHYLNQCWVITKVQWHSSQCNFTRAVTEISWKITYLKFCSNLPAANELGNWNLTVLGYQHDSVNYQVRYHCFAKLQWHQWFWIHSYQSDDMTKWMTRTVNFHSTWSVTKITLLSGDLLFFYRLN